MTPPILQELTTSRLGLPISCVNTFVHSRLQAALTRYDSTKQRTKKEPTVRLRSVGSLSLFNFSIQRVAALCLTRDILDLGVRCIFFHRLNAIFQGGF